MANIITIPEWIKVFSELDNKTNLHKLTLKHEHTYIHAMHIMNEMEKRGWITITKKGRDNHYEIINKELQKYCKKIIAEIT